MDQSYQESITKIKEDISWIIEQMGALDKAVTDSATNLANASAKLSAATPNDMTDILNKNALAVEKLNTSIQKSHLLEVKYAQEKEKLAKLQSARAAKEALDEQKLQAAKMANSEKIIKQKEREANAIAKAQKSAITNTEKLISIEKNIQKENQQSIKDAEQRRLAELNLNKAREKAFDDFEAKLKKQKEAEENAAKQAIANAEKQRLAEINLNKAREKAFDDYEKKQLDNFNKKAAAAQREASQDAMQIANQKELARAADLEAQATSKLVGAYRNLIAQREQAKKRLMDLISAKKQNHVEINKAQAAYNQLTARVNQANAATQNFAKGGLIAATRGVQNLLAAFGLVGGLYLFANEIKQAFNLARTLDSLNFAQKTIITNNEELARTQSFLARITEDYGQAIVTTTERYTKFLAAAKQSNVSLDDTEKIFGTMTKAAGALGLKADELEGIFLALEQMLSKGKVTTEELRRQLGERLPGAFGIMADALGVTVSELDRMLRAGEVLSAEALPKFAEAAEKAYGIENLTRVENLNASVSRLSNSWIELVGHITRSEGPVSKALMGMINTADAVIKKLGTINRSLGEMFEKGASQGENKMMDQLKKDADEYGVSIERIAEERLPQLQKELQKTSQEYDEQRKKLEAWKKLGLEDSIIGGLVTMTYSGMETRIKETGELMAEQEAMLNVTKMVIAGEKELRNVTAEPIDTTSYEDVTKMLDFTKGKYDDLTDKMAEFTITDINSAVRYEELKNERSEVERLIKTYTVLQDSMQQQFGLPEYEKPDYLADRLFIYEKLTEAKKKMESVKYGDDMAKDAVEAEIAILEKALEYWDGAKEKKKQAIKEMKDYSAEDAFSLHEGRLEREIEIQKEIRDNEENSIIERLDAQREASEKEIDLLRWRKDEAVRLAKGRTDLIKNINEQFYHDLMQITEAGEDQIEQIRSQDFDKRLNEFDKLIAADKFAMEKEIENVREIGLRRGYTSEAIEAQVLEIREAYLRRNLERQIDFAIKELEVFATTSKEKEEAEKRLENLRKQLNDVQFKRLKEGEDKEKKSWEERKKAALDYINAIGDIGVEVGNLFSALSNGRIAAIDEQLEASNRMYAQMLENEHLTDENRADLIEAQKKREDELAEKKRKERIRQAQAEKKFALFEIAINAAVQIVKHATEPWMIAFISVMAALQAATVAATPIPKYAKGRRGGKEEYAWLGDAGKHEPILDRNKKLKDISPDTPTVMKLDQGDTVLTDTKKLKPEHFTKEQIKNIQVENSNNSYENITHKHFRSTYLTNEKIHNSYEQIVNATIATTLSNASGNMDAEKLAKVFDRKIDSLRREVKDGIKDGFSNVKLPKNTGNKELADRLNFLRMRDAL